MNERPLWVRNAGGFKFVAGAKCLEVSLFRQDKSVVYVNFEVPNGAFKLRVAEKQSAGSEMAGATLSSVEGPAYRSRRDRALSMRRCRGCCHQVADSQLYEVTASKFAIYG